MRAATGSAGRSARPSSPPIAVELALDGAQMISRAPLAEDLGPAVLHRDRPRQRSLLAGGRRATEVTRHRHTGHDTRASRAGDNAGSLSPTRLTVGRSEHAGNGETRLPSRTLSATGKAPRGHELVPTSHLLRLSQARGHMCPRQVFVHEIHLLAPVRCGVHGVAVRLLDLSRHSERASTSRACRAARSARRDLRRARARRCPRRRWRAVLMRSDICARARSWFMRYISVLRSWSWSLLVSSGSGWCARAGSLAC